MLPPIPLPLSTVSAAAATAVADSDDLNAALESCAGDHVQLLPSDACLLFAKSACVKVRVHVFPPHFQAASFSLISVF